MTETQIMKFLCVLGYARAVVLQHIESPTDGHASFSIIGSQMYQYDNHQLEPRVIGHHRQHMSAQPRVC